MTPREAACLVCGKTFPATGARSWLCSDECRVMRRRARVNGSDQPGLPAPTRPCEVCGRAFPAHRGAKTCSPECRRERQRGRWRAAYHALPEERKQAMVERNKARRQADPEWARAVDARKRARVAASGVATPQLSPCSSCSSSSFSIAISCR